MAVASTHTHRQTDRERERERERINEDTANDETFFSSTTPQWGAADAEIKVPSGEKTELKRSFSL